jgi:hypothetical protein
VSSSIQIEIEKTIRGKYLRKEARRKEPERKFTVSPLPS